MVHIDNNKFNILTVSSTSLKLTNNLHHRTSNNNNMGKHKKSRI